MKKILKYESKRKINKQRFQFFLHKGGAVHFFLILATTIYIIANSIKQIIDTINKNELTFIEVKCGIGAREDLGRPTTTALENKQNFMEYLKECR